MIQCEMVIGCLPVLLLVGIFRPGECVFRGRFGLLYFKQMLSILIHGLWPGQGPVISLKERFKAFYCSKIAAHRLTVTAESIILWVIANTGSDRV